MEKMKDLKDLLIHEVQDLCSAEEQIIEALPLMIEKAKDGKLVKALKDHLKVTEQQRARLDDVTQMLQGESESEESDKGSKKGFLGFFGVSNGKQVCLGMKGLIDEGQKVMGEDMDPKVLDAAIIACAQKIEHYEICGYGTARAYARELNLGEVAERLEETLNEEYFADDLLTDLAVGGLNEEAEEGSPRRNGSRRSGSTSSSKSQSRVSSPAKKSTVSKKSTGTKKSAPSKKAVSSGRSSSKASGRNYKTKAAAKGRTKSSGGSKKKSSASGARKSRGR